MIPIIISLAVSAADGGRDFYKLLGLRHDCTDHEIERSFMKLSRLYHPDKNPGNATAAEMYSNINDAHSTLTDANKRRIYDLYGESGVRIYEAPSSELDPLLSITGAAKTDPNTEKIKRFGKTFTIDFPIDLSDFSTGKIYPITVSRSAICRCPTEGFFCDKCKGKPTIREDVNLTLVVERGCDDNTVHTFKYAGDVSETNGPGDIEVRLVRRPDPNFSREEADIHTEVKVTLREAILGFNRTITNFDGKPLEVTSNGPALSGQTVRVVGAGLPKFLTPGEYGDVVIHTHIKWPSNMSGLSEVVKAFE